MEKKKILVVDHSPFILTVMNNMLSELNYEVTTAESGFEAQKHVEATKHDMIITDLHMPGMSGIELTRLVKQMPDRRFIPIVMLSCEGDEEKIAEAKRMGVSTFLRKPVKDSQLKAILQVAMGLLSSSQSAKP
jgi:two-component system chemotaxis response regulator CheY